MPKYCWVLDAGHGPKTPGKRSPLFRTALFSWIRFYEFEFNRKVVERISALCVEKGIEHFVTIPKEKSLADDLEIRVRNANDHKSQYIKIFVSVHSNAGPAKNPDEWSPAKGAEVWHFYPSKLGAKIAGVFLAHILKETGLKNRGVKCEQVKRQFFVLRKTGMIAVLTETGFYNNREEVKYLITDKAVEDTATAHFKAILEIEEKGIYTIVS